MGQASPSGCSLDRHHYADTPGKWAMPFDRIGNCRVIATAFLSLSIRPCPQNSRSILRSNHRAGEDQCMTMLYCRLAQAYPSKYGTSALSGSI